MSRSSLFMRSWRWLLPVSLLALSACGEEEVKPPPGPTPLDIPEGCNPIAADADCLLPYPSDQWLMADPSLPSGRRVRISDAALPKDARGKSIDVTTLHPADGWSHLTPILALFPAGVSDANLPTLGAPTSAVAGPTVLIEAETGQGVLHFAELDPNAPDDAHRALFIRPLERLKNGTRYIVALRQLVARDGQPVPVPEGFRRIRDNQTTGDSVLDPITRRYEGQIFTRLEAVGVERASLQLAWDFTTESEEHVTRDMLDVRRMTMDRLAATPPAVNITSVTEEVDANVFRRIQGTIEVPLFLESDQPGAPLARDALGRVRQNGTTLVPFTAQIPRSLDVSSVPGRFLQYGHGFFGGQGEADGSFMRPFLQTTKMMSFTVDWWGMSAPDRLVVAGAMANKPSETMLFTDRVHQAMANQIAVTYAAKTTLRSLAAFQIGGKLAYDPEQTYYYGISQGHILGGTYLALSPHVQRGVLSVGGAGFSLMMFRAKPFQPFLDVISQSVPDPLDRQKFTAMLQTSFDRIDPITYAPRVLRDFYPGAPSERRVLAQLGLGDAQVPNVASHVHARALGLTLLKPAPREIPALPSSEGPLNGSGLVEFNFNVAEPLPGTVATPPKDDNAVHEGVRRLARGREQVDRFLRPDGVIVHTCDGVCDPE